MNDLISRKDVLNAPLKLTYDGMEWIPTYHIEELPSAEPEIIRCKDCKYWNSAFMECEGIGNWFGLKDEWSENGFCYKAERRTDE